MASMDHRRRKEGMKMEIEELEQLYEEQCTSQGKVEKEEKARSLEGLPFAGYEDFADCVKKNKEKANPEAYCGAIKHKVEGSSNSFVVQYLTYMGQVVVRGIPNQTWFLRIKEDGKIFSWIADSDFTKYSPVALRFEGVVSDKKFDFEGDVPPNSEYNPSKTLIGKMTIVDTGSCALKRDLVNGAEYLAMQFHGKELKGRFVIAQEEKGSIIYSIEKLSLLELDAAKFVLQKHEIKTPQGLKSHFDIKLDLGFEFSLYLDPLTLLKEGDSSKAVYKVCKDIQSWMEISEPKTKMMVGQLETYVTPIDKGKVTVIQNSLPSFISMEFYGEKLKGYFIFKEENSQGRFERAKVPHSDTPLPSRDSHPPSSTNLTEERTNNMGIDESLFKIVEHELERKKETKEERKISLELKRKKIELIEKWLSAQKDD